MKVKDFVKRIVGLKKGDVLDDYLIIRNLDLKYGRLFYKKKYSTSDVIAVLKSFGIGEGSNVFVHCGWDAFYNYTGNERELIDQILNLIGPQGTLAMPAIPLLRNGKLFNVKRTVTSAGIIAEVFRHYPGVKRSANVRHSVCAIGPLADELTATHNQSLIRFDEHSPYFKMCVHDFKIVSLGLPAYFIGTIMHCVEATLWREIPYFHDFYDYEHKVERHYIDENGEEQSYMEYGDKCGVRSLFSRNQVILRLFFDKSKRNKARLSNLSLSYVEAAYTYHRLCELARRGIIIYIKPRYHR